jgi:hypothetical protein
MRLWSLHPKYLDSRGLVALWRESLLAQAVLLGKTRGYKHHPQLDRFLAQSEPVTAIATYLWEIHLEASRRNYSFDQSKIARLMAPLSIPVATGQIQYEWHHLLAKLVVRDTARYERLLPVTFPDCHPIFCPYDGGVEDWERENVMYTKDAIKKLGQSRQ